MLLINKTRFWMNSVLGVVPHGQHQAAPSKERMREVNQKTLGFLFDLILKPRKDVDFVPSTSYKWNLIKPEHILQSDCPESQMETLIPLHDCVKMIP